MLVERRESEAKLKAYWVHWCRPEREWLWTARHECCNWCGISCEEIVAAAPAPASPAVPVLHLETSGRL